METWYTAFLSSTVLLESNKHLFFLSLRSWSNFHFKIEVDFFSLLSLTSVKMYSQKHQTLSMNQSTPLCTQFSPGKMMRHKRKHMLYWSRLLCFWKGVWSYSDKDRIRICKNLPIPPPPHTNYIERTLLKCIKIKKCKNEGCPCTLTVGL